MSKPAPMHLQRRPHRASDRDHPQFKTLTDARRQRTAGLQAAPVVVAQDDAAELAQMRAAEAQATAGDLHRAIMAAFSTEED